MVKTNKWTSSEFSFQHGVFQGDPWSPIIFLTAFNPILEKLEQNTNFGYDLNGKKFITCPFADDFNLITSHKTTHQRLIREISAWTKSMGLKLKPAKCKTLSVVSGKPKSVPFLLDDNEISTLENDTHKFLGSNITFSGKQSDTFDIVKNHFETRLDRINKLVIRPEYKIQMYSKYVVPSSHFILMVHDLTATSIKDMDATVTRYLKEWAGLPQCSTPAVLYTQGLTHIKSIAQLYEESHTGAYISSRASADDNVNHALDCKFERERLWSQKTSMIVKADEVYHKALEKHLPNEKQKLKDTAKHIIQQSFQDKWATHLSSLVKQGAFFRILQSAETDLEWKCLIYNLPRKVLKFLLNSTIDTLPSNNNLVQWNKLVSDACNLCGGRETLGHILNGCPVMLEQQRYTWRHNSVLSKIHASLLSEISSSLEIHCDLPGHSSVTVPPDILPVTEKPDLVIVNRNEKTLYIVELTVCFESGFKRAHDYKQTKYEALFFDLEEAGWTVQYLALEVGSRGVVLKDSNNQLYTLLRSIPLNQKWCQKKHRNLIRDMAKTAIVCSYVLFYAKFDKVWCNANIYE